MKHLLEVGPHALAGYLMEFDIQSFFVCLSQPTLVGHDLNPVFRKQGQSNAPRSTIIRAFAPPLNRSHDVSTLVSVSHTFSALDQNSVKTEQHFTCTPSETQHDAF